MWHKIRGTLHNLFYTSKGHSGNWSGNGSGMRAEVCNRKTLPIALYIKHTVSLYLFTLFFHVLLYWEFGIIDQPQSFLATPALSEPDETSLLSSQATSRQNHNHKVKSEDSVTELIYLFTQCTDSPNFYSRDVVTGTQCAGHIQQPLLGKSVVAQTAKEQTFKTMKCHVQCITLHLCIYKWHLGFFFWHFPLWNKRLIYIHIFGNCLNDILQLHSRVIINRRQW